MTPNSTGATPAEVLRAFWPPDACRPGVREEREERLDDLLADIGYLWVVGRELEERCVDGLCIHYGVIVTPYGAEDMLWWTDGDMLYVAHGEGDCRYVVRQARLW